MTHTPDTRKLSTRLKSKAHAYRHHKHPAKSTAYQLEQFAIAAEKLETDNTELLEALEAIYPYAERWTRGTTEGQPKLDKAQQAIKKARGS